MIEALPLPSNRAFTLIRWLGGCAAGLICRMTSTSAEFMVLCIIGCSTEVPTSFLTNLAIGSNDGTPTGAVPADHPILQIRVLRRARFYHHWPEARALMHKQ